MKPGGRVRDLFRPLLVSPFVDLPWFEGSEDVDAQLEAYYRKIEGEDLSDLMAELDRRDQRPPAPEALADEEVQPALERLLVDLSWLGVFFYCTEHLSDRELYEKVYRLVRDEPTVCFPDDPYSATTIDFSGCNGDDLERYLRFYASDEDRVHWARSFPEDPMPPAEPPLYPRNWVPVRQYPPNGE